MRISRAVLVLAISLVLVVAGCTKQASGTAQPDPNQPPLTLSKDGFGIVTGFDNAPTRIEIFTEPQCSHCADLQKDFGEELRYNIGVGALKVTYRPLIFLDADHDGYSAHVANAMFLAAEGDATGTQFQRFVEELWGHQERAKGGEGPSNDDMAEMAKTAAMPDNVAERIARGGSAINIQEMEDANYEYLYQIDSMSTGTPTVYDPATDQKLDIYDNEWLSKLMRS